MEEPHLYQRIADSIRGEILSGELKPGDRLPSVRQMTLKWGCTVGTVQRAYQELGRQGLVRSRAGQGTHVSESPSVQDGTPLRRAALVHRAEAFLLEAFTAGYTPDEVDQAVSLAMDHWRAIERRPAPSSSDTLRFAGSHDLAVTWLSAHFDEVASGCTFQVSFNGSLGGLIALAEGEADLAGSHLWDEGTDSYNLPFVERLLPGRRVALLALARRRTGLIVPAGNPQRITGLADLARPEVTFVNRQAGSGTRVWLDAQLHQSGVRPAQVRGYSVEKLTHSDVARAIAEGQAGVGLGLEGSARAFGLDFILMVSERYDLVIPEESLEHPAVRSLAAWLESSAARNAITALGGYETGETGRIIWCG